MKFERRPDPRCQRGMRFDYELERQLSHDELEEAVEPLFAGKAVRASEHWGAREVRRLILQFRFELRIGERDRQLSVLYRRTCPVPERERMAARLHEILSSLA